MLLAGDLDAGCPLWRRENHAELSLGVGVFPGRGMTYARVLHGSRDGDFVMISIGGSQLGLLAHPPNPEQGDGLVELNFQSSEPLTDLEARLRAAGTTIAQPTTDEGFGRQLQLRTPDGLLVKINELDQELDT